MIGGRHSNSYGSKKMLSLLLLAAIQLEFYPEARYKCIQRPCSTVTWLPRLPHSCQATLQQVLGPLSAACRISVFPFPLVPLPFLCSLRYNFLQYLFNLKFLGYIVTFLLLGPGGWHPIMLGLRLPTAAALLEMMCVMIIRT